MSNLLDAEKAILSAPTVRASLILKHGDAERWASVNPVLLEGELGIEMDTGLMKVGDGENTFSNLKYINVTPQQLEDKIDGALNSFVQKPETFVVGNLASFAEDGSLIDAGIALEDIANGGPVATETTRGTVLSSTDDNSVSVDDEGKMSLNRISTSNLFIPDGEELILSAGNSTI